MSLSPDKTAEELASSSAGQSPLMRSLDDFTHLQTPRPTMLSSVSKSQYCQVVFLDVSDLYPTDADIKCRYTLTSDVTAQPGDKIAIFKVGWSSASEFICSEQAPMPIDPDHCLSVTFRAANLPKDPAVMYQLCYVTSGNVIAGASIPFNVHVPLESELVAVEDPTDPGMVIFRSRVSQLQEGLQKRHEEYDELVMKNALLEKSVNLLKKELDTQIETANKTISEHVASQQSLENDKQELQEKFDQEIGQLKAQLACNLATEKKASEILKKMEEKYDSTKHENSELSRKLCEIKSEKDFAMSNISKNYEAVQEKARVADSQLATIITLQQDCERTTLSLKEQVKQVDILTAQNNTLQDKIRMLAAKNNALVLEKIEVAESNQGLVQENERLSRLCREIRGESPPGLLEAHDEIEMLRAMLANLEEHHSKCSGEISRLQSELKSRPVRSPTRSSPPPGPSSAPHQTNVVSSILKAVKTAALDTFKAETAEKPDREEAHKTAEAMREVRQQKADMGDELVSLRHSLRQVNKQLDQLKQDSSCKKNRIEVLELELRAANDELARLEGSAAASRSPEPADAFSAALPILAKFNDQVAALSRLQLTSDEAKLENVELKSQLSSLSAREADARSELVSMRRRCEELCDELFTLRETPTFETIAQLDGALKEVQQRCAAAENSLQLEVNNRTKLEQQLKALRAESVGKISSDSGKLLQDQVDAQVVEIKEMSGFVSYIMQFIYNAYNGGRSEPICCPLCPLKFPPTADRIFAGHFKNEHMPSP